MPICEFYCTPCHTIFNFFSKSVNVTARPRCPRCAGPLERKMSLFACIGRAAESDGADELPFDEHKLEGAVTRLAAEAENLSEEDPRQAASLMRKFSEMTGVKLGGGMEEALSRMEAGEDPEQIEADMGDILESEDPFAPDVRKGRARTKAPRRDDTLYDL